MYFPYLSERKNIKKLYPRKGGGGGGKGGSGGGGGSGAKGGSTGGGGSGAGRSSSINSGAGAKSATPFSRGGGPVTTIPAGQPFAGRLAGGGTRDQVYGNQQYGSGYPGTPASRGVDGKNFPFFFWPVAWGGLIGGGIGSSAYLHSNQYGRPNNSTRPGGVMFTTAFQSNTQNTTYRLFADNTTVSSLVDDIATNCSASLVSGSTPVISTPYNDSSTDLPKPEQAIQYYRASSVALTLDGYNNTGALGPEGTPDTPLPTAIDTTLLDCLNNTIGQAVPLIDGVGMRYSTPPAASLVGLIWILWYLL